MHFADRVTLGLAPEEATAEPVSDAGGGTLRERVDRYEAELIRAPLHDRGGDVRATTEALGVPRTTFYAKPKRHGIRRGAFDEAPG
ncbi:MAG: hypothetical protein U1E40_00765 [Amaricoccus sp.]